MNEEERLWWMVLIDAEAQTDNEERRFQRTGELNDYALLWSNVALSARNTLRDRFGVNFDLITDTSDTMLHNLFEKERSKLAQSRARLNQIEADLKDIEHIIKDNRK